VKILITGATGFIGYHVARILMGKSLNVRALVRQQSDISQLKTLDVEIVRGDIRDAESVGKALKGCSQLYHLAADYRLWVPDPERMYDINVQGTKTVMETARALDIEKIVYTSTVGVWAGNPDKRLSHEDTPSELKRMVGHYKRSKYIAEREVRRFIEEGLPAVIVNPATPIGPFDRKPTPTGQIIVDFMNGKIPAFLNTGLNFVDVADVAEGHWLASKYGQTGERYILGNENLSLRKFFQKLDRVTGKRAPRIRLPYYPVLLLAILNETLSKWITKRPPKIPLTGVRMAKRYMFFNSSKAVKELKMQQHPIENALENAVEWFADNGYLDKNRRR
jgi:dihydroflavonol-4-reductase